MKNLKLFLCLCLLLSAGFSFAQSDKLIDYIQQPELNAEQVHYFNAAMKSPFAVDAVFAKVNFNVLNHSEITVNLPGELNFIFEKENRSLVPQGRVSWIGRMKDSYQDAIHLAYKKGSQNLVGQLQVDDVSYVITPISGALHAIIRYDMSLDEGCLTPSGEFKMTGTNASLRGTNYGNQDVIRKQNSHSNERATGECNIRVLVAYTDDVDANRVDIFSDVVNMVNSSNTGYANSLVTYSIELAATYEVDYVESNNMVTDLLCIANTNDACLDDIHLQRVLWSADQCVLLTANGSGIAFVSTTYGNQFSVVGEGNFSVFSFQHELGHNAGCTHATTQTTAVGTAPYAGYGHTSGCFRTVLAYQTACGTGACTRHNVFSDNVAADWSCGASTLIRGNSSARNVDRLALSKSTIVGHETVGNDVAYSGDYNWNVREGVHFAANNKLSYESATNKFEYHSGSTGTFRASDRVTLGRGFHAKSGSSFEAYLESCTPLRTQSSEASTVGTDTNILDDISIYPNPFTNQTNIDFVLNEDARVKIWISDILGRDIITLVDNAEMQKGEFQKLFDATGLLPGIYLCHVIIGKNRVAKRLILQ